MTCARLRIDHHAALAKAEPQRIADEAGQRWPLAGSS